MSNPDDITLMEVYRAVQDVRIELRDGLKELRDHDGRIRVLEDRGSRGALFGAMSGGGLIALKYVWDLLRNVGHPR